MYSHLLGKARVSSGHHSVLGDIKKDCPFIETLDCVLVNKPIVHHPM